MKTAQGKKGRKTKSSSQSTEKNQVLKPTRQRTGDPNMTETQREDYLRKEPMCYLLDCCKDGQMNGKSMRDLARVEEQRRREKDAQYGKGNWKEEKDEVLERIRHQPKFMDVEIPDGHEHGYGILCIACWRYLKFDKRGKPNRRPGKWYPHPYKRHRDHRCPMRSDQVRYQEIFYHHVFELLTLPSGDTGQSRTHQLYSSDEPRWRRSGRAGPDFTD